MQVVHLPLLERVVQAYGLRFPERVRLVVGSRIGLLADLWNLISGRTCLYVVVGHRVHLSRQGTFVLLFDGTLPEDPLRGLLQEAERSKLRAFMQALRGRHGYSG